MLAETCHASKLLEFFLGNSECPDGANCQCYATRECDLVGAWGYDGVGVVAAGQGRYVGSPV